MSNEDNSQRAAWLQPAPEEQGLAQYLATVRERLRLVILAVVVTMGAAGAYVATAEKTYEAEAQVQVTPFSNANPAFAGLGLILAASDPLRAVETASALMTTREVAERVRDRLGVMTSTENLIEHKLKAEPVAESDLVAIVARDDSAQGAADLANAFAEEAIAVRRDTLEKEIDASLPALRAELEATDPVTADTLRIELATLERLRAGAGHPNFTIVAEAAPPSAPVAPRPVLSVAAGLLAGLVLGIGGAFTLQAIDPRVRREEQLRRRFRLPIFARVPRQRSRALPLSPERLSSSAVEAYRTLRSTLVVRASIMGGGPRVILVTGSSPSEGKTTTAINLAWSLAAAGNRVILIDADLRRPSVAKTLGLEPRVGLVGVLLEQVELKHALIPVAGHGGYLNALAVEHEGGWIAELYALPTTRRMITKARELADYVIIDSAPLTAVIDALPLARNADDVVLTVRLGRSRLTDIQRLGELLADNGIVPAGFVLIGTERPAETGYYHPQRGGKAVVARGRGDLREQVASIPDATEPSG